jgi:hypothetical protein
VAKVSFREKCIDAKGEVCIECGETEGIQVHHVDGDRSNNELDNLVPVCTSCHAKIHAGADGFEEWNKKLLPDRERKRNLTVTIDGDVSRDLSILTETLPADNSQDVVRYLIREKVDQLSTLRSRYESIERLRNGPEDSQEAIVSRALEDSIGALEALAAILDDSSLSTVRKQEIAKEFNTRTNWNVRVKPPQFEGDPTV